ncbi:MAG: pseudouridine synthase [Ferruginibacter sp.]
MSQAQFQKFVKKKKNSVVKEEYRQEKKKVTKERKAFFEAQRVEKNKRFESTVTPMLKPGQAAINNVPIPANRQPVKQNISKPGGQDGHGKSNTPDVAGKKTITKVAVNTDMPLNKYLAHCGVTSRRDAVQIIKEGKVKVNNAVITEPAYKVKTTDEVKFNGKKLFLTKNLVYILVNKPKDYITTTDDPQGRRTVLEITKHATNERIYPIGRLDRNTSGVLLMTNDGELTQILSHPSYQVKKIYEARLDKPLTKADFEKISKGLKLEDGFIQPDALGYVDPKDKSIIGIEIHSGKNRIVRRIFESLGYDVKGLDRVMYANLTKKNVERGKWRFLSEKEIRQLKFINKKQPVPPVKGGAAKEEVGD